MYEQVKRFRIIILVLAIGSVGFFWLLRSCDGTVTGKETTNKFNSPEELGRALFFDKRLSSNETIACASCHLPEKAFTDGQPKSIGVEGRTSFRNATTLLNVKDAHFFTFDGNIENLEAQALIPIQDSNEMNMQMGELLKRLKKIPEYERAAKELYNRDLDAWVITRSLAAFQRILVSNNSRFDRYLDGDMSALTEKEVKGWELFQEFQCIECHSLPNFTNYQVYNNGLYLDYGIDQGRFRIAGDSSMIGAFKVPSLRNIELTSPYMHDGSMKKIEDVLSHYASGGSGHINEDMRIKKRAITSDQKLFLVSFLHSLTDTTYMINFR